MTQALPGFDLAPKSRRDSTRPEGRIVRVQPDITAVTRSFDYEVPTAWEADGRAARVKVGSMVRVDFSGRRTAGWVTEDDVDFDPAVDVRPLVKWSGHGPPSQVIDLARWAAWRWAGRLPHMLRAASPRRMVTQLVQLPNSGTSVDPADGQLRAFEGGLTVVRTTPGDDSVGLAIAASLVGRALILVPTIAKRRALVSALRAAGVEVASYEEQWDRSAAGAVTVGTRLAAFAPMPSIDAVLVIDEHSSTYKEERTPSWNGRDVVVERARLAGVPCVLASPSPSLESLEMASTVLVPEKPVERNAWPYVAVVDLRKTERPGLLTDELVPIVRSDGPIACILNRKGRARMLACHTCDSLASCEECGAALRENDAGQLECPRDGTVRPVVCSECGATRMKHLRLGISRMAEDLAVLAKREVTEVSAETPRHEMGDDGLFIGTAALLHRLDRAAAVVFLDFDSELAKPRYRAAEDAFVLLALAARLLGPREHGGRLLIQTRRPDDVVVQGAVKADPGRVARAQRDVRRVFAQPPYGAWALISGAGADAFVDSLSVTPGGLVKNRMADRWRLSAPDHDTLLAAIHAGTRPSERVRIELDPLDL